MRSTVRGSAVCYGLLLLWGVALGLPLLSKGFPVDGHDFWAHTTWGGHFSRQFWEGEFYPRWLIDHNEGLGSPTFFFYPPLPSWLTAWLVPLFPDESAPVSALAWVATGMLVLSGWFTYSWLRPSVPGRAAVVAAAIYQIAPYHLLIDLYQRAAFAEFCAMTWFPLVLLAVRQVGHRCATGFPLLALAAALLTMTHPLSMLMLGPIVPAYAALSAEPGRRMGSAATAGGATALGLGLSGAYLVPALALQRHVNMQVLWQGWGHYAQYLYDWERVLASDWNLFHLLLLLTLVSSVALAALLYMLARPPRAITSGTMQPPATPLEIHFWMSVVVVAGFLLTRPSEIVWQVLPALQRIQFPWRLATVITIALAALAAHAAAPIQRGMTLSRRALVLASSCIVSLWLTLTALNGLEILHQTPKPELNRLAQDAWEYKPRWVQAEDFQRAVRNAKAEDGRIPKATLGAGGQVSVAHWRPRDIRLLVDAQSDSLLTVYQFYFPGWQALVDGRTRVQTQPSRPDGLVTLPVPAGRHTVELRLGMTSAEHNGWLLTGLASIVWIGSLLVGRHRVRTREAWVSPRVAARSARAD